MRCPRCHGKKWHHCLLCYGSGIVSCCDTAGENYNQEKQLDDRTSEPLELRPELLLDPPIAGGLGGSDSH